MSAVMTSDEIMVARVSGFRFYWNGRTAQGDYAYYYRQHFPYRRITVSSPDYRFNGFSWGKLIALRKYLREMGRELSKAISADDEAAIMALGSKILQRYSSWKLRQKMGNMGLEECERCHGLVRDRTLVYSSGQWCENCLESHAVFSDYMAEYVMGIRAGSLGDGDVADIDWLRSNGWRYSNRREVWYERGERDYSNGEVYDYHEGPDVGRVPSLIFDRMKVPMLAGVEIEMECGEDDDSDDIYAVAAHLASCVKGYAKFERDRSLDNGLEIITGYTGLDTHEERLRRLCEAIADCDVSITSATTHTCGLHVHIDRQDIDPFHAGKLMAFIHAPEQERLIRCIARRYGGNYSCQSYDKKKVSNQDVLDSKARLQSYKEYIKAHPEYTYSKPFVMTGSRYELVNFQNERTLEFRMFKGSVALDTIMASIEFSRMVWFFTRQASIRELTTNHFMAFIARPENRYETRYLRFYLAKKMFAMRNGDAYFTGLAFPGSVTFEAKQKVIKQCPVFSEE